MKFSHVELVLALAEFGSLRAASRHIGIAQSSLTRSLGEIEHELGVQLFQRNPKGVRLTPAGELFQLRGARIRSETRRIREDIDSLRLSPSGHVSLATSVAVSSTLLASCLATFRARYNNVEVSTMEVPYATVEKELLGGHIDAYVGTLDPQSVSADILVSILCTSSRSIVVRKGHPLLNTNSSAALASAKWVTGADDISRSMAFTIADSAGVPPPRIVVETTSALQLLLLVMSSDLITVLPTEWIASPLMNGFMVTLPMIPPVLGPSICSARERVGVLTRPAEYLIGVIERSAKQIIFQGRL